MKETENTDILVIALASWWDGEILEHFLFFKGEAQAKWCTRHSPFNHEPLFTPV